MNQTKKILSVMSVATLVALSAYTFIFLQVRSASRNVAEFEQEIQNTHQKQGKEDSVRNLFKETEEEREILFSRVVSKGDLVGFFEELEVLAAEAGVDMSISRISENIEIDQVIPKSAAGSRERPKPEDHPAVNEVEWMQMDLEAVGSWESVYRFLSFVELLPYHTEIFNIKVNQSLEVTMSTGEEAETSPENWRLTLTAKILQQKEK